MASTMKPGKAAGDDMSQRDKDSGGYTIASEFTTGGITKEAYNTEGTPEVGRGAEEDPANANKG